MDVFRQKNAKESLLSMMEAFVNDPLIRWKLLGVDELTQLRNEREKAVPTDVMAHSVTTTIQSYVLPYGEGASSDVLVTAAPRQATRLVMQVLPPYVHLVATSDGTPRSRTASRAKCKQTKWFRFLK